MPGETNEERAQRLYDRAKKLSQLADDVKSMDGSLADLNAELMNEKLWRRWLGGLMIMFAFAFIIFMSYVVHTTGTSNKERNLILDCTTPSASDDVHVCYERNQNNTSRAIQVIVDEVDRRTCERMEIALVTALERPVTLQCPSATTTTTTR